jgi:hypothetical protein
MFELKNAVMLQVLSKHFIIKDLLSILPPRTNKLWFKKLSVFILYHGNEASQFIILFQIPTNIASDK